MTIKDGTSIRQREVYLAMFPFTDLFRSKKRPVLVISNENYNSKNQDIICCYITTHKPNFNNCIEIKDTDIENGNLEFKSAINPTKIFTIDKNLFYKKLATLRLELYSKINNKFLDSIQII